MRVEPGARGRRGRSPPSPGPASPRRARRRGPPWPARGDLLRARVRAREPDDVVAALVQPGGERAADEPAGAGDEGAAHSSGRASTAARAPRSTDLRKRTCSIALRSAHRRPEADLDRVALEAAAGTSASSGRPASTSWEPETWIGHERRGRAGRRAPPRPSAACRRCRRASACPRRTSRRLQPCSNSALRWAVESWSRPRPSRATGTVPKTSDTASPAAAWRRSSRPRRPPPCAGASGRAARAGAPACRSGSSGWRRTRPAGSTPVEVLRARSPSARA